MCGIIGCLGTSKPKQSILEALEVLEYRGYDSAGLSILHQGAFQRHRVKGPLQKLKNKLQNTSFDGHMGIGHTRWATHGEPSESNAHPHSVGGVHIVHNGIIENHNELKLKFSDARFQSQTDSELIAHGVAHYLQQGQSLLQACFSTRAQLRGSYAVLVVSDQHPNEMVAFKKGPPLLMARSTKPTPKQAELKKQEGGQDDLSDKGSILISSDVQALLKHSQQVTYLEDGDLLCVQKQKCVFYSAQDKVVQRSSVKIKWGHRASQKQGYPHFMLKEIFESPQAVAQAVAPYLNEQKNKIELGSSEALLTACHQIVIVACGTSFYAGLVAAYWLEQLAGLPVRVEMASEFRYRQAILNANCLVLAVSQSGETADTLAALRLAKKQGCATMALCNVPGSSLEREAEACLYMNAGPEVGVASTKAFLSSLSVLYVLALGMAQKKPALLQQLSPSSLVQALLQIPSQIEALLGGDDFFSLVAKDLASYPGFLYMGRGMHYPIALEGALKLKELAYKHAEGYAAGEMKHGPLALIDEKMLVIALVPVDNVYKKTLSNLEEVKARKGSIIAITSKPQEAGPQDTDSQAAQQASSYQSLQALSQHVLHLPATHPSLYPLLEVVPLQLLAYHVACSLGHNVDRPRNLAKSVTVE